MSPALVAFLLAAAPPPPASKADALVAQKNWEELYLAYAAAPADGYGKADRRKLAGALAKGCVALEESDAVMAYSLGEKAAELEATADALLCVGRTGARAEQRSAAEDALRRGQQAFPKDGRFGVALARLLLTENDAAGALAALEQVPKKAKERAEADQLRRRAQALADEGRAARAEARADEQELRRRQDPGGTPPPEAPGRKGPRPPTRDGATPPEPSSLGGSYESSVDEEGRRIRANKHFRFRYFNGQRDFGQRADYEGRVQGALEEARAAAQRILGEARESPTDVILYSKAEFTLHHGAQAARAIAGFYSENAIRMNDSAEINGRNKATLVHEYVHAVVDELAGFRDENVPIWVNEGLAEWVEWRYQGQDGPEQWLVADLRGSATRGTLPTLQEMGRSALISQSNPALAYALSGSAVKLLVKFGGVEQVLGLIRDCGKGQALDAVLQRRFDMDLARLQERVNDEVKSR